MNLLCYNTSSARTAARIDTQHYLCNTIVNTAAVPYTDSCCASRLRMNTVFILLLGSAMTLRKLPTQDELDQIRNKGKQRRHAWYKWYILLSKEQREQHYKACNYSRVDRISDYNGRLLQYFIAEGHYPTSAATQIKTEGPANASEPQALAPENSANSEK